MEEDRAWVVATRSVSTLLRRLVWWGGLGLLVLLAASCTPGGQKAPALSGARPTISGDAVVGEELAVTTGEWSNQPSTYRYSWLSCDAAAGSDCATRQTGSEARYTVAAADEGRTVIVEVTAANSVGEGTARSEAVGPVQPSSVPIRHHCGGLTADETWDADVIHVVDCTVATGSHDVTIAAGAVVKVTGSPALRADHDGAVTVAGTAADPVVVTSIRDDSVGGDSGGDGASDPRDVVWNSGLVELAGGALQVDHGDFRWLHAPVTARSSTPPDLSAPAVTIRNSVFSVPEPMNSGAGSTVQGHLDLASCGTGQISGNRFERVSLNLSVCSITVADNAFAHARQPLSVSYHDNLALIDLTGAGSNTFTGTDNELAVYLGDSSVPAGSNVVFDTTSGAVLNPGRVRVAGQMHLSAGSTIKTQGNTGFVVDDGGVLDVAGTTTNPVIVTSIYDDSIAGDTGGDGPSNPRQILWNNGLAQADGGAIRIDHGDFRWLHAPVTAYSQRLDTTADEITIRNSTFSVPEPLNLGFGVIGGGYVSISGCAGGQITDNHFDAVNLSLTRCSVPVASNTFADAPQPLSVSWHDNLALIDLTGAGSNTFTGADDELAVYLDDDSVPAGTTAVLDTTSGAVFVPSSVRIDGEVRLAAGTTLKNRGNASFVPNDGGALTVAGTAADPVVMTSMNDDSIGGDSGGDGASDPTQGYWNAGLVQANGGAIRIDHADLRWLHAPVTAYAPDTNTSADEVTVVNSTISVPEPLRLGFGVITGGYTSINVCDGGQITNNHFEQVNLSLHRCSIAVADNQFSDAPQPLSVSFHDNLPLVDLAGADANTFSGSDTEVAVTISDSFIPDGTTWTYDRLNTGAVVVVGSPIRSSRGLGVDNGSVMLLPGGIVKGSQALFDLGPRSDFRVVGTAADPVVFTSVYDDFVGGDSDGGGSASPESALNEIFLSNQFGAWEIAAGFAGLDLSRVGPGTVNVDHAVVRHTGTAFSGCLVCRVEVHNTDFVDVETGVSQAYYFTPVICQALMGPEILEGGNPHWNPANATNNYWGGPGPSPNIDLAEIAFTFLQAEQQYRQLIQGLPLEQMTIISEAKSHVKEHIGSLVSDDFTIGGTAGVNLSVQWCQIPIINVGFPVVINPVDFADPVGQPIHAEAGSPSGW